LSAPFVRGVSTHGTGCTYSAAIAAYCALGCDLPRAVQRAKEFITQAIVRSQRIAGHWVLNFSVPDQAKQKRLPLRAALEERREETTCSNRARNRRTG
jgi:hydroxymethylpyrimidine/phosphomethylpyrimidine kinase